MSDEDIVRQRAEARIGQTLRDKWKLERVLGVGGMASVYAATHRNGKRGAVKVLHSELASSSDARARFLREGYVANTVSHRGAVSVLDDDVTEDGSVYLVMELLDGSTVDAVAESRPNRKLRVEEVIEIADELLDVLAVAHDKCIVHRDLKPENLFLTREGGLRVLDFGIARLRQTTSSMTATRTGDSMGTPAFMPPEQALGDWDKVDGRTDLWAVGATMFTLLTGKFVHDAENVQKMMLSVMTRPAPPIRSIEPTVPHAIATVIDCALMQRPEDRFPDARTMQAAVRAAASSQTVVPAEPGAQAVPRSAAVSRSLFSAMTLQSGAPVAAAVTRSSGAPHLMTAAPVSSDRESAAKSGAWKWAVAAFALALVVTVGVAMTLGFRSERVAVRPSASIATAAASPAMEVPSPVASALGTAVESAAPAVLASSAPSSSAIASATPSIGTEPTSSASADRTKATAVATARAVRPPPAPPPPPPTAFRPPPPPTVFSGRF